MVVVAIVESVRRRAAEEPDRPAVTDGASTLTRRDVDRLSDGAARRLQDLGVAPDAVVAMSGPNSAHLLVLAVAIWKAGAVPLHLHARKGEAELVRLLALGRPDVVVGFDDAVVAGARSALPGCATATMDELFAAGAAPPRPAPVAGRLRIGPSGGSSGRSKLISVDVPAVSNPERPWHHGMRPGGTHVVPLAITDGTGFVATTVALAAGCHQVLMVDPTVAGFLELVARHRADWLALTHPMLTAVAKLPTGVREAHDLASVRWVTQYSGAVAPWVTRTWIDWLGADRFAESYGATDARASSWITGTEWLARPGSVGRARAGGEIAILDAEGQPCPAGTVGRVFLRDLTGRRRFHYLGHEAQSRPGGWETVGDSGWADDEGYLYLLDRTADIIAASTGPTAALPIEGALESHPDVRSAVVVGIPGSDGVETIHAVVDCPGRVPDEAELRRLLDRDHPHVQPPDSVEWCSTPLRDEAGKAQRQTLRAARRAG